MLASIIIGSREWIAPAVALGVFAGVVVVVRYSTAMLDNRTKWLAAACKGIALATLTACLLEPLWSGQRVRPGAKIDPQPGNMSKDVVDKGY